jgi:hypothetical protein
MDVLQITSVMRKVYVFTVRSMLFAIQKNSLKIIIFVLAFNSVALAFLRVTVSKSDSLEVLSSVIGWIYFAAWSVSFYPQVLTCYFFVLTCYFLSSFQTLNFVHGLSGKCRYNIIRKLTPKTSKIFFKNCFKKN